MEVALGGRGKWGHIKGTNKPSKSKSKEDSDTTEDTDPKDTKEDDEWKENDLKVMS
jgi:hypothetical protein